MVKAILMDGLIQPTEDLPATWEEGQALVIDVAEPYSETEEIRAWSREIADLDTWTRDLETLAVDIPPEDFLRLNAALTAADKEAKDLVRRRQFGSAKGLVKIAEDFDEPLEDFREYM